MLDEGLRAGLEFFGLGYRTIAFVEREAYAAALLVARMEEACLDTAPVWSDLTTFDGRPWRGRVDFITAGFPCQPHSVAGKRSGLDDDRWIWPDIARIVGEVEPAFVWLENVPGLVSTGGLEHVLFDLASLGFDAQWGVLAASDVGASHRRERIFLLASTGRSLLGNAESNGRREGRTELPGWARRSDSCWAGGTVADAGEQRPQGREFGGSPYERDGAAAPGSAAELCALPIFAPGPSDERWADIIERWPSLAPAVGKRIRRDRKAPQSTVRLLADGLADILDESRSDQLRVCGNGVVPLQAAGAFVELVRRMTA